MARRKVMFVLLTLGGGGVGRLASLLLEHLERERFEPCVALLEHRGRYPLPLDIPIACFHKKSRYDLPRLIWRLARAYDKEKPDVVLSFMNYTNLIAVLARRLSRNKPRLLLSEHGYLSIEFTEFKEFKRDPLSRFKGWAIPWLYPQSDGIVCVSQGVADDLVANFRVPRDKINVIYNPADIDYILTQAGENVEYPWFAQKELPIIIAIGRLTAQKGYPYLLKAFAQVTANFPCRLVILGEGRERVPLEELAQELGVEKDVAFLGFQENPFKYLARSDFFVLSSLWEGFGNVIIEAMACGTPVIATRCPSGPDEIITDGVNGLLVPVSDEAALVVAIWQLLNEKDFASKLAQAGRKRAEDFAIDRIAKQYQELFWPQ